MTGFSVAEQDKDAKLLLNHYRRIVSLRKQFAELRTGEQRVIASKPELLVVERVKGAKHFFIVANLSAEPATFDHPRAGKELIANGSILLRPWQAALFEGKAP
jgi:glycosidase